MRNPVLRHSLSRRHDAGPRRRRSATASCGTAADVGPSFFETMDISVIRGRTFTAADFAQERRGVIVNEAFVKRYFPNDDPVGKLIGDPPTTEIIGVVRDARLDRVRTEGGPMMYAMAQRRTGSYRGAGSPDGGRHGGDRARRSRRGSARQPAAAGGYQDHARGHRPEHREGTHGRRDQRVLQPPGIAPGVDRHLRRGLIHGRAADQGTGDPHGVGGGSVVGDSRVPAGHDAGLRSGLVAGTSRPWSPSG